MSEQQNDDTLKNFTDGLMDNLSSFGKKVGGFVEDVFNGEGFSESGEFTPRSDVYFTTDQYIVEVELPGVKKEETNLHIHEGVLTVKGIKRMHDDAENFTYTKRERRFGSFLINFTLPLDVEMENIKAKYEAGILTIRLPWAGGKKKNEKDIEIN
ncbi:MAG: Hsp20/alpha crystallin family protein [Bacteroidia bacterium]|nr:Hsp20/alpha crystallin family protein [Bacteroidia bacterium]